VLTDRHRARTDRIDVGAVPPNPFAT
jgi:hypothetical protein